MLHILRNARNVQNKGPILHILRNVRDVWGKGGPCGTFWEMPEMCKMDPLVLYIFDFSQNVQNGPPFFCKFWDMPTMLEIAHLSQP
jgi:hypothetical protein